MFDDISEYTRRPRRYAQVDGLNDLLLGIGDLGWALVLVLQIQAQPDSIWRRGPLPLLPFVILVPLFLLMYLATCYFRGRYTFPRTGYVAYRGKYKWWIAGFVLGVLFGCVFAVLSHSGMHWLRGPFMIGVVMAAAYVVTALWWRLGRYFILGAVSLLIGTALELQGLDFRRAIIPYLLLLGIAMLVSGAWTMYSYLRRTRPPETEAQ